MQRNLQVVNVRVGDLIPYARNARTHSEEQVEQIVASMGEFGWTNPVLIRPDNTIIAGHGRLMAAQRLGMSEVPCIVLDGLTDAQYRALVIADNKLALNAGWDDDLLSSELADLEDLDYELSLIGFSDEELDKLIVNVEDYSDDFSLPNGEKSQIVEMSFLLHTMQADAVRSAMMRVKDEVIETFGNENINGNLLYEVVRQWAEQKK